MKYGFNIIAILAKLIFDYHLPLMAITVLCDYQRERMRTSAKAICRE